MAQLVIGNAKTMCTMGLGPGTFMVLPVNKTMAVKQPAANVMDNKPFVNILPFPMCQSLMNPTVASATAAALGVLTPMPCTPMIPAPWAPGSATVKIGNMPALNNTSKCVCAYGGNISIVFAGQVTVNVA